MSSRYRPEIDGLRAIAVLAVVLFHMGTPWVTGGFVGVDVFFVISGYLITRLIVEEFERTGDVSFADFYRRRIARLFPALFVVVAACFTVAAVVAPPDMMASFAESAIGALLSVANVVFWNQSGYFDAENITKPLLHTWSLAVEEQFYLVWPLLLVLCLRRGRNVPWIVLGVLGAASLAGSIAWQHDRASIYYLLPFRVFELAIGAGLVRLERRWPVAPAPGALAVAGFAMILVPVFGYTEQTLFPSYNALLPCVGTALLIHVGSASRLSRAVLANRVAVGVGLISYSLYLVHWPLLVFVRLSPVDAGPPAAVQAGLFVAMLALAFALHRTVEQPMRRLGATLRLRRVALASAAATLVVALPALHAWRNDGWLERFPVDVARLADAKETDRGIAPYLRGCWLGPGEKAVDMPAACYRTADDGRPNLLLLGDSTAFHFTHGLAHRLRGRAHVHAFTTYSCPILPEHGNARNPDCRDHARFFYRNVLPANRYDIVLISANTHASALASSLPVAIRALEARGADVVVIGPHPTFDAKVPDLIAAHGTTVALGRFLRGRLVSGCGGEAGYDAMVGRERVFSVNDVLCESDGIRYAHQGRPLFVDSLHFGRWGSAYMADRLVAWLDERLGTTLAAAPAVAAPAAVAEDADHAETIRRDLLVVRSALARYHRAHGRYPRSSGFDGLRTKWGRPSPEWIAGLAPRFIAALPRDSRRSDDPHAQYLYRSDGTDYKLIAHGVPACGTFRARWPDMIDPQRDCTAMGFWTAGAAGW